MFSFFSLVLSLSKRLMVVLSHTHPFSLSSYCEVVASVGVIDYNPAQKHKYFEIGKKKRNKIFF